MPSAALKLSVTNALTLKKPSKNNPLPTIVLYVNDQAEILGALGEAEYLSRAEALIDGANFKGGLGEHVSDYALHAKDLPAITLIGVGKLDKLGANIAKVAANTYAAIKGAPQAALLWGDVICHKHFTQFVLALQAASYRFDHHKSSSADADALKEVILVNNRDDLAAYETALGFAVATDKGISAARDVANEAPNVLTPSELAKKAKHLSKAYADKISVTVLGEKKCKKWAWAAFWQ